LRDEIERLREQVQSIATTIAHQQSVFIDIAGARTAELHQSLAQVETLAGDLRAETERMHDLQDAISHHLHDLVLEVVQPELRNQLGTQMPELLAHALAPEMRRAVIDSLPGIVATNVGPEIRGLLAEWLPTIVADTVQPELRRLITERLPELTADSVQPEVRRVLDERLPEVVANTVSPQVRALLSDWLPVMVADTVQPEVRAVLAERLPDVTATAVQPELRRVLAERLPHLVAETVQPEVRAVVAERLPSALNEVVTPEIRDAVISQLPNLVGETVRPEIRQALDERLPGLIGQVVSPEVRRVLAERLPHLVAETVQPEVRQTLADRLPHLVSETVRPEVRETLDERLPGIVAQVVSPEVRRMLAERLPSLVADTVQPELRQVLANRLPAIVAEAVGPTVGELLIERVPGMLADTVTPELSVTLAEMEAATAELRQEAAKLRGLREVVAERLPASVMSAVEPHLQEVLTVRFPRLVTELVEPVVRSALVDQMPALVAAAVQPDISQQLGAHIPQLVADTIQPELRQIVARALEERLPAVVSEAIRPELREGLGASLPSVVAESVTPEVVMLVAARLPALVGEAVNPDLTASLADLEGCAAEMRAETARMRSLREVVAERLPEAVMGAVQSVLDENVVGQLPDLLARLVKPAVQDAVAAPIPAALSELVEPALQRVLARQLPSMVERTFEREVELGLSESLPAVVASATEPAVRAALSGLEEAVASVGELRQELFDRLSELAGEAAVIPYDHFAQSSAALRNEAERLVDLRAEILQKLTVVVEESVAVPLAEYESSAAQLRVEAERMRSLRNDLGAEMPKLVLDAVDTAIKALPPPAPSPPPPLPGLKPAEIQAMVQHAVAAALADIEVTAAQLRAEAERLRNLGREVTGQLPGMVGDVVEDIVSNAFANQPAPPPPTPPPTVNQADIESMVQSAVSASLANVEDTASQLRAEAERLRDIGPEVSGRLPGVVSGVVEDIVTNAFANQPSPSPSQAAPPSAEELDDMRAQLAADLPRLIQDAVGAALRARDAEAPPAPAPRAAPAPAPAPSSPGRDPALWETSEPAAATPPIAAVPPPPPPAASPAPAAHTPAAADVPPLDPALAEALAPAPSPANGSRTAEAAVDDPDSVACILPGVTVGPTLARGVSEAVSRARLRRRRRRRAGPPSAGLHRRDPFATELTRRLEWFALARRQAPNGAMGDVRADPCTIPAGERDGHEVGVPLGRTGGVCLVGPRAKDVGRALVLTFLATHDTVAARALVVGDLFPATASFPGLGRARDVNSLLSGLQSEASRRQAMFTKAGVQDLAGYRAQRPEEPLPVILVAAAEMTTLEAGRLGAVLDDGARVGIVGVLVDAPLEGMLSLRLQGPARVASATPDPLSTELVGSRLFTVEREPGAELLDVLASARSDLEGEHTTPPADEPFEGVATDSPLINVRLLGGFRIDARGREIRAGLRAKAKELLAFYLLHPEGTTLEEATEALWPEADPRRGSEWFWTALGNLRSRLRSATENPDLKVIERDGDRYRIEPLFEVDLWKFEQALAVAGAKSGDPGWATLLQDAAALYGGELLAGVEWPWAEVPREDLRGRAVDVLVSLAATRLVAGDVRGALEALERAVEIDPLAEQLYRRIMRLHAKLSRPDQADAAFRTLVARLGEFDLQPSPESEKLHAELCGTT
jgi:DNA-binding SARP family transcriptional activator